MARGFKICFQQIIDEVSQFFLKKSHSIYKTLLWYNKQVDQLLCSVFPASNNITLIAIGGYGRKERALYSDLDLLILASDESVLQANEVLHFIHILQAAPVKVGYSVHTCQSALTTTKEDLNFLTAIIDMRFVSGCSLLFDKLHQEILAKAHFPSANAFIQQKYQEQLQRDERYPIDQQPDIKNSIGALRYLQTVHWLLAYMHPQATLQYLVDQAYLTKDELKRLVKAHRFLCALRFYLHILHNRQENRLLISVQEEVADFFIIDPAKSLKTANAKIEYFMQNYYCTVRDVKLINRMLLASFSSVNSKQAQVLDGGFIIRGNVLVSHDESYPKTLLEVMNICQLFNKYSEIFTIDAQLLRGMHQVVEQQKKNKRPGYDVHQRFLALFDTSGQIKRVLSLMTDLGVFELIIPEFTLARGQMQFDLYHQYTVDRHTIEVIDELQKMMNGSEGDNFPILQSSIESYPAIKLLFIAALFHDIGKGSGIDHAKYGAKIAKEYGFKWQLKQDEIELIIWLVKAHLLFSNTVKRKDIYDEEVIKEFAKTVGSIYYLDSLLILTVADIKGTNKGLWNGWLKSSFKQLYLRAREYLLKNRVLTIKEQVQQVQQAVSAKIDDKKLLERMRSFWVQMPARYFTEQSPDAIAWQSQKVLQPLSATVVVYAGHLNANEHTALLIIDPHNKYRISQICNCLYKQSINIHEAKFFQLPDGSMLYQFYVTDFAHKAFLGNDLLLRLQASICMALQNDNSVADESKLSPLKENSMHQSRIKTSVEILTPRHKEYTAISIKTMDQPGILAKLCAFIELQRLQIIRASIYTAPHRIEDTFYVTDLAGHKLKSTIKKQLLRQRFLKYLSR